MFAGLKCLPGFGAPFMERPVEYSPPTRFLNVASSVPLAAVTAGWVRSFCLSRGVLLPGSVRLRPFW